MLMLVTLIGVTSCKKGEEVIDLPLSPDVIADLNKITFTVDGVQYVSKNANVLYTKSIDKSNFLAHLPDGGGLGVTFKSNKTGSYKWGDNNKAGEASIFFIPPGAAVDYNHSIVRNCQNGIVSFSPGQLKITKFGAVGDFVEGEFSATLYQREFCGEQIVEVPVTGTFKLVNIGQ